MMAADKSATNIFSVSLVDGRIVISENQGSETANLTSRINTYGDGQWHYIAAMKMGKKLTINIDDTEIMDKESVSDELMTETPLYFGGLPPNALEGDLPGSLKDLQGVDGCVGDITINQQFQNLANTYSSLGVTLDSCSVQAVKKEEERKPMPTMSPDKCSLMPVASDHSDPD